MDVTGGGERAAISRLRALLPVAPDGQTWLGDDAAVLADGTLLAIDTLVERIDFTDDLEGAGWKAAVANISDIAAMGGEPVAMVVSVAGAGPGALDALYSGLGEAAEAYGCPVVGGDLSDAPTMVVTVAIVGRVDGGGEAVRRRGARPGDAVYVTGPLGAAAASGWRRRPAARVAEGRWAREAGATAMIDVSDGFGLDLVRLAEASGVGVRVEQVPVAPGATEAQAWGGGEDFELLYTLAADVDSPHVRVGVCTGDPEELPPATGWEHRL